MGLLLKSSLWLGAVVGFVFGLIYPASVLLFKCIIILIFTLIGAMVVVYLKKNAFVGLLTIQDGAFIGGISGFSAAFAAMLVNIPFNLSLFFSLVPKSNNFTDSVSDLGVSILIILMFMTFIAALSALFNTFSGLVAAYCYEKTENPQVEPENDILIDD